MTSRAGRAAAWILLAVGTLVAAYLTFEHFTGNESLVCGTGGAVDCASVTTSDYSRLFGAPVAVLGLLYFLASLIVQWRASRLPLKAGARVETLWYGAGLLFVLYLVWAELVPLGKICLWCTVVHVVVLVLFLRGITRWVAAADE